MQVQIRQLRPNDIPDLTGFFNHPSVVRNITQLPYGTEQQWQHRLQSDDQSMTLVAEHKGKAIGCITLVSERGMRRKHVASLAMAVNPEHHNQRVGTQLLEAAMLLADEWMNIARIELGVYTSNRIAIKLYQYFGFTIEGEAKAYAYGEGKYQNLLYMARVRKARNSSKNSRSQKEQVPTESRRVAVTAG